jgi:uncharacterized protein YjiS (DUF1127 family)
MNMSSNISALQGSSIGHGEVEKSPSLLTRLVNGMVSRREAQARRYVQAHLNGLSDTRLKDLGFTEAEIAEIRATKSVPASYWL